MSTALQNKPIAGQVQLVPIRRIYPNPLNPRGEIVPETLEELAASIREVGIISPLLVTPHRDGVAVVYGHRRRLAGIAAGLTELPVIVQRLSESEQLLLMLTENLLRSDLSPLEEARAYERVLGSRGSKIDLARRLGIQVHRIESRLMLLRFEPDVAQLFERGALPVSFARALVRVPDAADQRWLASKAARGMTLRQLEKAVSLFKGEGESAAAAADDGGASERQPARRAAADDGGAPPLLVLGELTRSQADLLLAQGDETVSFELLRGALAVSCDGCDEQTYPDICKACPLPSFIGEVVRRAGRLVG